MVEHIDGTVSDLDSDSFEDFISTQSQTRPVVIDGYTTWCPPCKIMAPILEKLAKEYGNEAVFAKIDLDRAPKVSLKYSIRSVPTFLIFSPEGESLTPYKTFIGAVGDKPFRLVLDELLKKED